MTEAWNSTDVGVLRLPSGRLVRGRGLSRPLPAGQEPTYAVYLLGSPPPEVDWEADWLRWPDFRLPSDRSRARELLALAWERAATDRVELACAGGRGRTGTALACIAVLDGIPAERAVEFVRRSHHPRAVETPWQKRYVRRFRGPPSRSAQAAPGDGS
ncbi:protein phosphatase [Streptomyces sp. NPDC093093]|uniref:protein-tyrosine phosphatase family protein n=1 Tax=Streptomyces sp. NPDC093093 TaxID=3366025 RepID=UPI00380B65A2